KPGCFWRGFQTDTAAHNYANLLEQTREFNREATGPHDAHLVAAFQPRKVHDFIPRLSKTTLSTCKPFCSRACHTLWRSKGGTQKRKYPPPPVPSRRP